MCLKVPASQIGGRAQQQTIARDQGIHQRCRDQASVRPLFLGEATRIFTGLPAKVGTRPSWPCSDAPSPAHLPHRYRVAESPAVHPCTGVRGLCPSLCVVCPAASGQTVCCSTSSNGMRSL